MDWNKDTADIAKLQPLFDEAIERVSYLDPGYSGHASDVWLVKTRTGERVVRSSRWNEPPSREFWWGCFDLFGIDPRRMLHFEANASMLSAIKSIPAPRVLKHTIMEDREYLVVEKMSGSALSSFTGQPDALFHQLGVWLAQVHSQRFAFFGNLARTQVDSTERFHDRLANTMRQLVERDYPNDSKIKSQLDSVIRELTALPVLKHFCPVFIDLDPSQFLIEDGLLSAVVDVEAYVVGPREFDFIGLEYVLDEQFVAAFLKGYSTILQPPDLSLCRTVYRYFYRLLGVQGSIDLDRWLAQKILF